MYIGYAIWKWITATLFDAFDSDVDGFRNVVTHRCYFIKFLGKNNRTNQWKNILYTWNVGESKQTHSGMHLF